LTLAGLGPSMLKIAMSGGFFSGFIAGPPAVRC
jgi:hypothetical protein